MSERASECVCHGCREKVAVTTQTPWNGTEQKRTESFASKMEGVSRENHKNSKNPQMKKKPKIYLVVNLRALLALRYVSGTQLFHLDTRMCVC